MKIKATILLSTILSVSACTNYESLGNALAPNMTKQEVVNILGNPTSKEINGKKERYYYKGYRSLYVYFDENGLLERTY